MKLEIPVASSFNNELVEMTQSGSGTVYAYAGGKSLQWSGGSLVSHGTAPILISPSTYGPELLTLVVHANSDFCLGAPKALRAIAVTQR
jgi:hypothetical protein